MRPILPRRQPPWDAARVVSLGAAHRSMRAIPRAVFLAGILADHAPEAATLLLADIDLAAGDAVAPRVARALLAAIRYDGFPVYPENMIDEWDACTPCGCLPASCLYIPLGAGEAYWEEQADEDRPLPEVLVAGIADGWTDAWPGRAAVTAAAREAGDDVAALVMRALALEEQAMDRGVDAAAGALVADSARLLAALPPPLDDVPVLAAYAAAGTGNLYLDHYEEWWNQQTLRDEWLWSVSSVRRLRREWAEALTLLARVEAVRRALSDRACWPRVLTALVGTLAVR